MADPRLLARFDAGADRWRIAEGSYRVALGEFASDLVRIADVRLMPRLFGRQEYSTASRLEWRRPTDQQLQRTRHSPAERDR